MAFFPEYFCKVYTALSRLFLQIQEGALFFEIDPTGLIFEPLWCVFVKNSLTGEYIVVK